MRAPAFELAVATDPGAGVIHLRLLDGDGCQVAAHQVRLADHAAALWEGLFDTRAHVERYAGGTRFTDHPATPEELLERLGLFLGREVLGPEITAALAAGVHQRTLLVRQPSAQDPLAAACARVPWEIARPGPGEKALAESNLVVRTALAEGEAGAWTAPPPETDEPLRLLLIFAEAPGSRPLAMRLEREELLTLFHDQVMPGRRVEVDVLCHGVTRERLRRQVESAGGYHLLHWSGHGHGDLLELAGEDGDSDPLSGEELVELLEAAGGFIPHLVFLSACLSGALVAARSWPDLEAALEASSEAGPALGRRGASTAARTGTAAAEPSAAESPDLSRLLAEPPGYTGTALALLRAGVPQVVAMRYEVGDAYARDLALGFYRHLLANQQPKDPATALSRARRGLLSQGAGEHEPVDHATPLLFGRAMAPLSPPAGRSPALDQRYPRPQPLLPGSRELDRPATFVGRSQELTRLPRDWLDGGEGAPAVALIQGLAGLGKTALAAEAVHLGHRRFAEGVFAFQAKPRPLPLDDFLRTLDLRLARHSPTYRRLTEERPGARLFLPVSPELAGEERYRLLADNLLAVLRDLPLLLVLDNFETQLESLPGDGGYACADPEWDRLLVHLSQGLPGSGSRLLLTSRHRLAALAPPERALTVPLGPLPMGQAALFLQQTPALRRLTFSSGPEGRRLALDLLQVSRGHPLLLTRLGVLAGDPPALAQALEEFQQGGLAGLPDFFTRHLTADQQEQERLYLEDVAVRSVELLLSRLTPPARRLLWVVTRASEPVPERLLAGVWSGRSVEEEVAPPMEPLLEELEASGLLTREGETWAFHELVREGVERRLKAHPDERGDRTEEEIWQAYGRRYATAFQALQTAGREGAREQAAEAGRRGLSYLVRARAFEQLGSFAGALVTGTRDPGLLQGVIAELSAVAEEVPAGKARWSIRTYLADAFRRAGRPDMAFPLYQEVVAEAEAAEEWANVGTIRLNWANAMGDAGHLDAARESYKRSADAHRKASSPEVNVVGSELEALRIDVMQGGARRALTEIEARLAQVRTWWRRHQAGEAVPEAPEPVFLGRALIGAMDIAEEGHQALEHWEVCLELLAEIEVTKQALGESRHELAVTRFNRYGPLLELRRFAEARRDLEGCLTVFREVGDSAHEAKVLSALANLWYEQGDPEQAVALQRQALAVTNRLPVLEGRSISHNNLSNYLSRLGEEEEAARHLLAAITYDLLTGHRQLLFNHLHNLSVDLRRDAAAGRTYALPRLAVLLARPEFEPLRHTLDQFNADPAALQSAIDPLVEQAGQQLQEPSQG